MANHGALCLGADRDETFKVATALEQICEDYIMRRYLQLSGREDANWDALRAYYLAELAPGGPFKSAPPASRSTTVRERAATSGFALMPLPGSPFRKAGRAGSRSAWMSRPEAALFRPKPKSTALFTGILKGSGSSSMIYRRISSSFRRRAKPSTRCSMTLPK